MTEPNIAFVANLLADPSRAAMCLSLAGGEARPAGELAARAGISAQAASNHLAKLIAGRLLRVEQQGRWRYYRLNGRTWATPSRPCPSSRPSRRSGPRSTARARRRGASRTPAPATATWPAAWASPWPTRCSRSAGSRTTASATGSRRPAPARSGASASRWPRGARSRRAALHRLDRASPPCRRPGGHRAGAGGARPRMGTTAAGHARGRGHPARTDAAGQGLQPAMGGARMITLSIRYTIDARKRSDFEEYARALGRSSRAAAAAWWATGCRRGSRARRTRPWP